IPADRSIRVRQLERRSLITLRVAGRHLLTLTDQDLMGSIPAEEQADLWETKLQEALKRAQYERTGAYRQQVGQRILFAALGILCLYLLLRWWQRRLRRRRTQTPTWQRLWGETGLLLLQWGTWLGFAYWLMGRFPQSRSVRYWGLTFLRDTFTTTIATVGDQGYSILDIAKILALILGLWLAVRTLTGLIRSRVLQAVGAGRELQDAIALLIQITLTTVGCLVLLQAVGIDISSLAILVSVIGVGVGFGLQNIANNFISGLIIMLERPIQVGDFVKLGNLTGTVERIGIRSTEISTLDRISIIVPNSEFIDSKVINWSHGYPVSRLHIPLGVAYGSSIKQVRQTVLEAARHHPQVLRYPKPQLWFEGLGESSLDFTLLVWIREPRLQFRIKSDLYYLLEANLRRYQIEIPFPQRDLHIRSSQVSGPVQPFASEQDDPAQTLSDHALSPGACPTLTDVMDWCDILEHGDTTTSDEIQELVTQMRGIDGVDIRDRRFGLQVYRNCFVGSDAVQWMMQHQLASREEAIRLGQLLVERGIIHHVTDEHSFQDTYLFYRFFADEASRSSQMPKSSKTTPNQPM
ncbi:MAG: mechanosensitive ion channel, partial [Leptolyngbya sp. SIO1D8]|nr:mechanosensitive ion channel [Leptolyngbya sp. SIO1D8]